MTTGPLEREPAADTGTVALGRDGTPLQRVIVAIDAVATAYAANPAHFQAAVDLAAMRITWHEVRAA